MPTDKTLGSGDSIAWNNKVSCNSAVVKPENLLRCSTIDLYESGQRS